VSLALLFPGQGSQHIGMGRKLADALPAARLVFQEADEILATALSRLMWEGPEEELTLTRNAQPAILVHSVATHTMLRDRLGETTIAAGHSLGEFSAHVAAGTLSFPDALRAVRVRGELMFDAGVRRPGTMAAVLGLSDDAAREACAAVTSGICVPANFNADGQVVISGDRKGVEEGMARARSAGAKRVLELKVSGAFHSPLMAPAEQGLRTHLEGISFSDPSFPVVSNVTAEPVGSGSSARDLLIRQLTAPVLWSASVNAMRRKGANRFLELGPGAVLCGLNKRNSRGAPCVSVGSPVDAAEWAGTPA
jgi:[acyl-carrier-protein] S-malonyltransferase